MIGLHAFAKLLDRGCLVRLVLVMLGLVGVLLSRLGRFLGPALLANDALEICTAVVSMRLDHLVVLRWLVKTWVVRVGRNETFESLCGCLRAVLVPRGHVLLLALLSAWIIYYSNFEFDFHLFAMGFWGVG